MKIEPGSKLYEALQILALAALMFSVVFLGGDSISAFFRSLISGRLR